jgi:hypothetical protein
MKEITFFRLHRVPPTVSREGANKVHNTHTRTVHFSLMQPRWHVFQFEFLRKSSSTQLWKFMTSDAEFLLVTRFEL